MKRLKAGILGTVVILVLAGSILTVVAPSPRVVTTDVKLAGHTTSIIVVFWWTVQYWFLSGGGTGTNPMPKPSN